jgi:DNA primase
MNIQLQEIKERLPITEVLADYVTLKKAGVNFKAVCPFHNEKTPSLIVSPAKGIWHCFGCGLGGDIFEFIKQAENVEFVDALKILADRAGVELRKPTQEEVKREEKKADLYEINDAAAKYYTRVLWESESAKEALNYLKKRGLTERTIQNWRLGWAPDDFHYLENFLAKSFDKKDIELAGLIIKKDQATGSRQQATEEYFDRFRGRIMFPILNIHGQVVGFTGRLLHEKENAGKYINSPETPIYNKSKVIYGFYQAKQTLRKLDYAIIVEGNLDVITSHQAGFTQTVASSGTAFTEQQLLEVKKLTNNLVFAFDSDKAGVLAAERTLTIALNLGFGVKIIKIRDAKDPDELIKRGIGIWQKAIDTAPNYIDFVLEESLAENNRETPEGIAAIESKIVKLIAYLVNPVISAHYVRKLSESLNLPEKTLFDRLKNVRTPQIHTPPPGTLVRRDKKVILEDLLLGLAFMTGKDVVSDLDKSNFTPENATLVEALQTKQLTNSEIKERVEYLKFAAGSYLEEQSLDGTLELAKVANEYKKIVFKKEMETVAQKLNIAEKAGDKDQVRQLSELATKLTTKIANLR